MRIFVLSTALALAATGALADVTYNVVGFPEDKGSFGVVINKKMTPMTTTNATYPLWTVTVPGASGGSGWRYVKLSPEGKEIQRESFLRSFVNKKSTVTDNQVFLRINTKTSLPALPQVYTNVEPLPSKAFDETQMATIHITANEADFADMVAHPLDEERKALKCGFRFINADTIYSAAEVKVKVSGHGSRKYQKLSLRVKFDQDKGETFFDRPIIKLRSETSDPTLIREKTYGDILNAIGVKASQAAWVRVYVNNKPFGFHLMMEDIEEPFLRTTIHKGQQVPKDLGSLYQMGSHVVGEEATMLYLGPNTTNYNPETYENKIRGDNTKAEPMAQLIAFMKDLQEYDPTLPNAVKFWNTRLDVDGFLKAMVMEYLAGAWDSYWWKGNNFFMYYNPVNARWQFIATDFDSTFSDGGRADVLTTYKKFAASRMRRSGKDHPLVSKLIYKNKEINALFEKTLLTVTQKVFNPNVLNPRLDAYAKMIEDEVKWDLAINRSKNPGKKSFSFDDFQKSMNGPVTGVTIGIKPWIAGRAKDVPPQITKK
ncbi:spore coat protein H [Entomortierella parvispora]|uniref:Spore coat protein H n=1 Tax=Entomortierella parvispora TaxID=205924 RepID=A0A9P3H389_9FUNG|nr:spore coat protein H [Entomortierella parvispora]